jgi:hypothetical protein
MTKPPGLGGFRFCVRIFSSGFGFGIVAGAAAFGTRPARLALDGV